MSVVEKKAVNAIRTLSIDAVDKANSGHPGMPMGAAPMAYVLWTKHMNHNPANPEWANRDRFVLSAGHGSMLLYSLLHLTGYDLKMEDLKAFRQWGSRTPGHPEFGHTPGVEATTGPLGQGLAMATGMAMAERHLADTYNRDGFPIVDHYTYSICGDGDVMEGISGESASLAGHLKLGRLIVLYDSNDISLDGDLNLSFSENVAKRYEAYGWQVIRVEDGNDLAEIDAAIAEAKRDTTRPTMIEVKTVIGYGSPNRAGTSEAHGKPLGQEENALTRKHYEWEHEPFEVPDEVYSHYRTVKEAGQAKQAEWESLYAKYQAAHPELAKQFAQAMAGELPEGWDAALPAYEVGKKLATRQASGEALNGLAKNLPYLIGGSADLAGSNNTLLKGVGDFHAENYGGRNLWFGVREHAMGAAMNGMSLHGGLRVYGGTFFVFSDYLRPAIRLAALMKQPVIYVLTHDSIAVGEDGPTHEPVEHLPALRVIPGLTVMRPADAAETAEAYRYAVGQSERPVAMVLTRQGLPVLEGTVQHAREGVRRGAYIVAEASGGGPEVLLLASGSEVSLAVAAYDALAAKGVRARVVSMPAWDLFESQPQEYKDRVLPPQVKARVGIEMAMPLGWERYVGDQGAVIGIHTFGASAPGEKLIEEYGFTVDNVLAKVEQVLKK
jgi:transketolase